MSEGQVEAFEVLPRRERGGEEWSGGGNMDRERWRANSSSLGPTWMESRYECLLRYFATRSPAFLVHSSCRQAQSKACLACFHAAQCNFPSPFQEERFARAVVRALLDFTQHSDLAVRGSDVARQEWTAARCIGLPEVLRGEKDKVTCVLRGPGPGNPREPRQGFRGPAWGGNRDARVRPSPKLACDADASGDG